MKSILPALCCFPCCKLSAIPILRCNDKALVSNWIDNMYLVGFQCFKSVCYSLKYLCSKFMSSLFGLGNSLAGGLLEELSEQENGMGEDTGEVARGYTEGGLVLIPDKHAGNTTKFSWVSVNKEKLDDWVKWFCSVCLNQRKRLFNWISKIMCAVKTQICLKMT